ncbi:hypothetical protein PCO85_13420 [Prodigiosinella aquatilis]|nr:hypothetical protein [Prodigiosinella sp. LS101]WJV52243.1 hypothetical protein PCO85_13420 [Prodigiosinella sp. LS101]WJV56599.1 hypothetical protein PCO84_13415 [Pectobacteriaceae bacterium C111]
MADNNKVALSVDFSPVKIGLALVFLMILMNIFLGILFGVHEDFFQNYIHAGIMAHPSLFTDPAKDQDIIWRWVESSFPCRGYRRLCAGDDYYYCANRYVE